MTVQVPLDTLVKCAGGGPPGGVEGGRGEHQRFDLRIQPRAHRLDALRGRAAHRGGQDFDRLFPRVQRLTGHHLEEERTERVDVGAGRQRIGVLDHFGRDVSGRTEERSEVRLRRRALEALVARAQVGWAHRLLLLIEDLRQAPIQEVHLAVLAEHDVGGLEVPMNDTTSVDEVEGETELTEVRQEAPLAETLGHRLGPESQADEDRLEGAALHPAHREIRRAFLSAAEIVDRDDRGVLQLPLHPRFEEEARPHVISMREALARDLHGDVSPHRRVEAELHLAHATGAQRAEGQVAVAIDLGESLVRELDPRGPVRHPGLVILAAALTHQSQTM